MSKTLTVAEMAVREVSRRRGVLLLLFLLPLAFYVMRRGDYPGQSVRSLFLGVGWAVSTAALFSVTANRGVDLRLRLSGYRSHHVYLGRMLAMWALGIAIVGLLVGLLAVDQPGVQVKGAAVAMVFCVTVGAPLGLLLALVVDRELEGTLMLLTVVAVQMTVNPASTASRVMPFWSSREIATFAVDHTGADYLVRGVVHGVLFTAGLTLVVALVSSLRPRVGYRSYRS